MTGKNLDEDTSSKLSCMAYENSDYRIEGEGGGEVSGARVNSPLIVRCRLEALLAGLPQQRVQLLPLSYHLRP